MIEIMMNVAVEVLMFLHASLNVADYEDDAQRIYSHLKPVLRQHSRHTRCMMIFARFHSEYLIMIDNCLASVAE